jgi:uncharacterized protein
VVNLAGEKIDQRWSADRKQQIRESRLRATTLLARAIAERADRPRVFVSGSAVGIYGDRGDETLDERSAPGDDLSGRMRPAPPRWPACASCTHAPASCSAHAAARSRGC